MKTNKGYHVNNKLYGILGAILAVLSIGCACQMITLIDKGESYTANLWFHPISGFIAVVLLIVYFRKSK
ncbi:hypothetical protein B1772_00960 [Dehalococcoides mccartyi]|uniref:Lipoprotein n=1 Tax=Dehalococcoides mccartyi TaxID=61435 RepID=A0A2J1DY99_9CHLR|nr:hypothetical protein X794_01050 [Dehalococcoides mccartyi CG5]AQX74157.1 hypothetical protein B1776_00970 [Dehalococcoides mccartyi]AQY72671.1 hypothetical protein B1772_00960 [Dehalococcoides mccartyi]OBW62922.1 MAG: hypothetical protein A9183_00670 [Dehalococcoides mccartyi]PKH47105.1 hypothetical protein CVH13_00729 [Dehalococcoides mccartyi]